MLGRKSTEFFPVRLGQIRFLILIAHPSNKMNAAVTVSGFDQIAWIALPIGKIFTNTCARAHAHAHRTDTTN